MPLPLVTMFAAAMAPCTTALCQADTLEPYFDKLAHATNHTEGRKPVHILQIGDSHTAGDNITGGWRDLLQAQYGSGGRGVSAAGRPYGGYVTYGATSSMSPGWTVKSIFGGASVPPRPSIGLSGFSISTAQEGATVGLTADPGEAFNRFTVCAMTQPGAGSLSIQLGLTSEEFNLNSFTTRSECRTVAADQPQLSVQITVRGGPVTITSWGTFRDNGGVVVSNVGVSGSQFIHQQRADESVISEELRSYKPDLVVIAFGTNEGFAPRVEAGEYEIVLRSQIQRIRRLVRNVPILLLGAPDANTRNVALANNAVGGMIDCNRQVSAHPQPGAQAQPPAPASRPNRMQSIDDVMPSLRTQNSTKPSEYAPGTAAALDAAAAAYTPPAPAMASPSPAPVMPAPALRPLFVPPGLAVIRDVQRRVAAELNIAFWDWQARMGGACSAAKMVFGSPPLMRGDFVHYNRAGGWEIARKLQADLAAAAASTDGR